MSRFVQRDSDGKLIGHYANPQPGYAEEELPDDHPDILAWQAARKPKAVDPAGAAYAAQMRAALAEVAPVEVLIAEILLAMNHLQISGQVNWSGPMNEIINKALPKLAAIRPAEAIDR